MNELLCDFCKKKAKYIWWTEGENYDWGSGIGPRPVLYPLCEDHGSNMFPRVEIEATLGDE